MATTSIQTPSLTTQIPPSDQTPARDERVDTGRRRPRQRGRGGNRGGAAAAGNINEERNRALFHGRGRGGGPGGRGRGAPGLGRGRGRGGPANISRTVAGAGAGRSFGGQLTRDEPETADSVGGDGSVVQDQTTVDHGSLRADAPAFVPGQPVQSAQGSAVQRSAPPPSTPARTRTRQPKPVRPTTKSTAHDIATRTHEDIAHNLYECPICTSELSRKSKVWSCTLCWTVFHLSCIKKWSSNEGSAMARPRQQEGHEDGEDHPRQWRCPGCNLPHDILPSIYSCWCGKEPDPRPLPGLPPHSCGQTCSKARKGCPHPCDSVCHAGPCPPCTSMGPTQPCFCGRHESTKRCVDTDYENGWSCGEPCEELLPCLEHKCPRPCHEGLCGACEQKVDARCYCGKSRTQMMCSNKEEEKQSRRIHHAVEGDNSSEEIVDEWTGCFDCREICDRPYDCGLHTCQKRCHPQDADTPHCPNSPDVITHCACGKTPLSKVPGFTPRTSCQDPIPNCNEPCGKPLRCQHKCPVPCHTGPCPPCFLRVTIHCRCGKSSFESICHQGSTEPPQCFRMCKATMNCGRHTCGERCCPGERKAIERQATKRKLKSLNIVSRPSDNDIEAEHICTRVCGRMLKCSTHTCPELCHKGPCGTCREAIFEEISCACGRSVLYPPLPCGTRPPPCRFDCTRPKSCGHPQTAHNCHPDDESCPKCPFLTEKRCLCGKKTLKNQPCWLTDARCGLVCGKELKCGSHTCQKHCHRPGECEDANEPCHQPCGKIKKLCSHPCSDPCHAPFSCQEKTPCQSLITTTCPCGRLKQEKRCNASRDKIRAPQSPTPLKCDEECGRLERNRTLASALNVSIDPQTTSAANPSTQTASTLPYSEETLDLYLKLSTSSTLSTLQTYQSTLHSLATSQTQRSARFPPARSQLRAFIHSLAADWGFKSESFDPEPHRHVLVFKSASWLPPQLGAAIPGSLGVGIGGLTVGDCAKMRDRERMREREAKRLAAAAAEKLKAENQGQYGAGDSDAAAGGGGWAQVASRKRATGPAESPFGFGDLSSMSGKAGTLVLRSGVGKGRGAASGSGVGGGRYPPGFGDDVVDDWEEEVEKEEREREREQGQEQRVEDDGVESKVDDAVVAEVAVENQEEQV